MELMEIIKSMFSDSGNGSVSSKRVITFLSFLLCSIAFLSNLFWGFKVDSELFKNVIYIVITGLGFTASEKFAPKG